MYTYYMYKDDYTVNMIHIFFKKHLHFNLIYPIILIKKASVCMYIHAYIYIYLTNRSVEAAVFRLKLGAHSGRHWEKHLCPKGLYMKHTSDPTAHALVKTGTRFTAPGKSC